jgi:mannose-1-phosphate guanylyltransferase
MKALILAAGEGRRLRPLTNTMPKPMVEVAGRPVLEHNVRLLAEHGITDIAINLHYRGDVIRDYFGDGSRFDVKITYSEEPGEEAHGTAGALLPLQDWFEGPFVVCYGDTYSTVNLGRMIEWHYYCAAMMTMAVVHREDVKRSGIVGISTGDRITRFIEKPKPGQVFSHWINAGMLVCEESVIAALPHPGWTTAQSPIHVYDFGQDIIPKLIGNGAPLYAYRMVHENERILTLDTPDQLEATRAAL